MVGEKLKSPLIGCTSMVLWDRSLVDAVHILSAAGYDTIEIWADHLNKTGEAPGAIEKALRQTNLRCTVHCPIIDVNICSMNQAIADTSLDLYLAALTAAESMDAVLFVFHAGSLFSRFDPLDTYEEKLHQALDRVLGHRRTELLVVVENMESDKPEEVVKDAGGIAKLLARFGEEIGVCWDCTHLISTAGNIDFLQDIPRIDHIHLSDALYHEGQPARKHLRLGQGNLDFERLFSETRARQARVVSLETVLIDPQLDDLVQERSRMETILER